MPVQADFVPLDTAKTWAKRLARTSKTLTPGAPLKLSQCQLAVAQMLGYEHWHAMQQALNATAGEGLPLPRERARVRRSYLLAENGNPAGAFWFLYLGGVGSSAAEGSDAGEIHIEARNGKFRMRQRIHGRLMDVGEMEESPERVLGLLKALFESEPDSAHLALLEKALLSGNGYLIDYVSGRLTLPNVPDLSVRYQALPVYPNGFDLVVKGVSTKKRWTLKDLHLLEAAQKALMKATSFEAGVFFFASSTGTGKSSLMAAVLNELSSAHHLKQGERRKKVSSVEDSIKYVHDGWMTAVEPHGHADAGPAYAKAIDAALRAAPDYLMVDDFARKETAQAVFAAVRHGTKVFTSFNSTREGVLERVRDFDVEDEDILRVRGWACPRLLPVLCQECCQGDGKLGEMKVGPGCHFCQNTGYIARQMVVDVWECDVKNGLPALHQTASQMEQARRLVKENVVSRTDAEEQLGPLEP